MTNSILFITHQSPDADGRTSLLISVLRQIGEVHVFCPEKESSNKNGNVNYYFSFRETEQLIKKYKTSILFIDNRLACIEGLYLKMRYPDLFVIQDSRELYSLDLNHSFRSNVGTLLERVLQKQSDVVICANSFRADYLYKHLRLKNKPLVYENVRKLEKDNDNDEFYSNKYSWLVEKRLPIILSTSGCDISRTNDELVREFKAIDENYVLVFVGGQSEKDLRIIQRLIKLNNINNVFILGRVSPSELQYLVSISTIGIVNYGQFDLNNIYCASGKLYEFIFEKIPVVATSNPPLKALCEEYKVGFSSDSYLKGIREVTKYYQQYVESITHFIETDWIAINNDNLSNGIKRYLTKRQ